MPVKLKVNVCSESLSGFTNKLLTDIWSGGKKFTSYGDMLELILMSVYGC